MRRIALCGAFLCGFATLVAASPASAGCCGAGYAVAIVPEPLLVVTPREAYPVGIGLYPYLHGHEFYNPNYYKVGPYGNPVGYRGYYHPYAAVTYSGLPGVGTGIVRVGPDYVRARHQPEWRFADHGAVYHYGHGGALHPLRPEDK
jgi:hypothetical protein